MSVKPSLTIEYPNGASQNRDGVARKRAFVCSPYRGDVTKNIQVAQFLCKLALAEGYAPFAPHLIYTGFLKDEIKDERDMSIDSGIKFLEVCDVIFYFKNKVTEGMEKELKAAESFNIPAVSVFFHDLENL